MGMQRWASYVSSVHMPQDRKSEVLFCYPGLNRFKIFTAFGETRAQEIFATYLIRTETLNQKETKENRRHTRAATQRNWGSFSVHRSVAGVRRQLGGLNFLGPFENTKHKDCSGGGILHRGPSESIADVQFCFLWKCSYTCFSESIGQLKYSNSWVSTGQFLAHHDSNNSQSPPLVLFRLYLWQSFCFTFWGKQITQLATSMWRTRFQKKTTDPKKHSIV